MLSLLMFSMLLSPFMLIYLMSLLEIFFFHRFLSDIRRIISKQNILFIVGVLNVPLTFLLLIYLIYSSYKSNGKYNRSRDVYSEILWLFYVLEFVYHASISKHTAIIFVIAHLILIIYSIIYKSSSRSGGAGFLTFLLLYQFWFNPSARILTYLPYLNISISYWVIFAHISIFCRDFLPSDTCYTSTDHVSLQEKICIVISGNDLNNFTTQTAINTFPHASVLNLSDYKINYYMKKTNINEETDIASDDFEKCIQTMLSYDLIVFVTPVYWYSTTTELKTFFDRLADLLYVQEYSQYKTSIATKKFAAIVTYARDQGYALPIIQQTCEYFDAEFITSLVIHRRNLYKIKQYIFRMLCIKSLQSLQK